MGLPKPDPEQKPVYRPGWRPIVFGVVLWAVFLTAGAAFYRGLAGMIASAGLR